MDGELVHSRRKGSQVWRDRRGVINADLQHCGLTVNADTLFEGVWSFGHLVKRNETLTASQFADRVERHYDAEEPRTRTILRALRMCGEG